MRPRSPRPRALTRIRDSAGTGLLAFRRCPRAIPWILCIVLLGCRTTSRPIATLDMTPDLSQLERQVFVRMQIVSVRSHRGDIANSPTPCLGFNLEGNRLRATDALESLAGLQWPEGSYRAWLDGHLADGSATIVGAFESLAEPGRRQEIVRGGAVPYIANWRFDSEGVGSVVTERMRPSSRLALTVSEAGVAGTFLVSMDLAISAGALEEARVVAPRAATRGRRASGIAVQTPRESLRRVVASGLVADGHACVLAHWVRQKQAGPPQHLLFVMTVQRVGRWETEAPPADATPLPANGVFHLLWRLPPGITEEVLDEASHGSSSVRGPVSAERVTAHQLRALMQPGEDLDWIGLSAVENSESSYEMTESVNYVMGLSRPTDGVVSGSAFDIGTATAGVRIGVRWVRGEHESPSIECRLKVSGPPLFRARTEELRTVRQPAGGDVAETYRFTRCLQAVAEGRFDMSPDSADARVIRLPCRLEDSTAAQPMLLPRTALVAIAFRPAASRSPPQTALPGNGTDENRSEIIGGAPLP